MGPRKGPIDFSSYLTLMNEKLESFKNGFSSIVDVCNDIDSASFHDSVAAIWDEIDALESDDDMENALSLLDELLIHVNDLDDEFLEPYAEIIEEINVMADELRDEAKSA